MPRVFVAGVGFDALRESEALARADDFFRGRLHASQKLEKAWGRSRLPQKFLLVTPNPEMVLAAQKNSNFKKVLNSAQLAVADGIGILWASYFLSLPKRSFTALLASLLAILFAPRKIRRVLPARITGSDLFPKLLELAAARQKKVFLLGAAPGVAEKVQKRFTKKIAGLAIVGTFAGSPAGGEEAALRSRIDASGADALFVAFGAPTQELWLTRNLPKLKHVKFAAGIGGAFDFHAGVVARAPRLLQKIGLEWLWRLLRQPSRLPRIWNATFRFVRLVWRIR